MSIPRRILVHVTVAAGLVIAVASWVRYRTVFEETKQSELRLLQTYVDERARTEEASFRIVQENLALVRGQFLKRLDSPLLYDRQARWDERFRRFPDGAWRSREQFADGRKYSTLWMQKDCPLTPDLQHQILAAQDICDELLPVWADLFPSVYFVLPGWANIGFDPRIPSWVWDTPADYNPSDLEWFRLAIAPEKGDGYGWTGVIEEPTTGVPIVSVYLPIHRGGRYLGSVGHDIAVTPLMEETGRSNVPGAIHVVFRPDGRLIAHPAKRAEILASKGELRMQDSEPALASLYRAVSARQERSFSGYDDGSRAYYTVCRLAGPEWFFVTTVSHEQLQRQAFSTSQWVLWVGLLSLVAMTAVLATTLRQQIARPLQQLTQVTRRMSGGDLSVRADVGRDDELGDLAKAFNDMASHVDNRDMALRQLNQDLERRVLERTQELSAANRQLDAGRQEALRLLERERELSELRSDFVSLVSHEFRTPLEVIMSSADNLERYYDRLSPEKREHLLQTINKSVRRMSGMMEETLVLGRLETDRMAFTPVRFEWRHFCRRICDDIEASVGKGRTIRLDVERVPDVVIGDENLLRHVFINLLSNAMKYSAPDQPVHFTAHYDGGQVTCHVTDHGCGIPATDQPRLFKAFQRGGNVRHIPGTGLGLLIVQRCVALHGGEISFTSTEGQGTTFTVIIPLPTCTDPA